MAKKQRGPLPPVLSTEETRVRPPEEDEELPPEDEEFPPEDEEALPDDEPSWDPQRDSTQLLPKATAKPEWDEEVDDVTPPIPRKHTPVPLDEDVQDPDDATRPIPRKTGKRAAHRDLDDATRPIPRKTGARPALQDPDDATRPIPRKTGARPALQDPDDATRPIPRKSGSVPSVARESSRDEASLPWQPREEDDVAIPARRSQSLPPIISGPQQALVSPPEGPPVLVPVNTEPHYIRPAPFAAGASPSHHSSHPPPAPIPLATQPHHVPPTAPIPLATQPHHLPPPAPAPVFTAPNYVPPPPAVLSPVVTAPHLVPTPQSASEPPPGEELRTTFSNKAAMVADLVKATFARRSYGAAPYRLRIDEPDGPSTAGGLHARQPISLVSNLDSAPAVVCGWVDVAKKEAQLRSYGVVVRRHQSRYSVALDITEEEYDRFLNELVETLFYGGIKIVVQVPDDPDPTQAQGAQAQGAQAQAKRGRGSCLGTLLMLAVTFALGIGVGLNAERFDPLIQAVRALLPGH